MLSLVTQFYLYLRFMLKYLFNLNQTKQTLSYFHDTYDRQL